MKLKIIALAALGLLIYSCASKTPTPVAETPVVNKIEPASNNVGVLRVNGVLTEELAAGKSLYENNCAKCHKLYSPKDYSSQDWKPILIQMQKKAHLNDAQIAGISDYINSQL